MLRLTHDQVQRLDELLIRRRAVLVSGVLAEAWPAMTERLKERWPAFVEAALLQGRRHDIEDIEDMAHYASLWCIWGPGFEDKPGFDWAREILADPRRGPALKVHQLLHRTREELGRRQPASPTAAPVVSVAQFDAALRTVDGQAAVGSAARAVFVREGQRPVFKACDLGTVDLMVADVENLAEYRHLPVGWQRTAAPRLAPAPVHWTRAPEIPLAFAVPSHALRAGPPARLNLKVQMLATCDPRVHPEVAHLSAQGRLAWRGRDTQRLSLALYALPLDPAAAQQGIAAPTPGDDQMLSLAACGQRDAGAPFGEAQVVVRVVPATQWLTELRHPAWPAMAWPGGTDAGPITPPAVKLEADGAPRDASAWQREWAALPTRFRAGMDRLFNAWIRCVDAQSPRLEVDASPLIGEAGFTWGWRRTDASTVAMRAEGKIDLIACAIDLRLSGEIVHGAARARITLACKGRSELRTPILELGGAGTDGQDLKSAVRSFRFPFSLDIESLAGPELATLSAAAMPDGLLGAIAGECGLRPRPDGAGFQWFFSLRVDPVSVELGCADPVLGPTSTRRDVFLAMSLLEWTAG